MNAFWSYFWPPFGAGLAVAIIAGAIAFRRRRRRYVSLGAGAVIVIALAALWHGPLGAADRFAREVEQVARQALIYNEIPEVSGHLHHGPLTRRLLLSGPADDFQRNELVIVMDQVPGVESVSWSKEGGGGTPLIVEGALVALLGFLFGLLVAYLRELRRRYNAEWKW
jgi:membrane protease YdiL (CAAX protease family)